MTFFPGKKNPKGVAGTFYTFETDIMKCTFIVYSSCIFWQWRKRGHEKHWHEIKRYSPVCEGIESAYTHI